MNKSGNQELSEDDLSKSMINNPEQILTASSKKILDLFNSFSIEDLKESLKNPAMTAEHLVTLHQVYLVRLGRNIPQLEELAFAYSNMKQRKLNEHNEMNRAIDGCRQDTQNKIHMFSQQLSSKKFRDSSARLSKSEKLLTIISQLDEVDLDTLFEEFDQLPEKYRSSVLSDIFAKTSESPIRKVKGFKEPDSPKS